MSYYTVETYRETKVIHGVKSALNDRGTMKKEAKDRVEDRKIMNG